MTSKKRLEIEKTSKNPNLPSILFYLIFEDVIEGSGCAEQEVKDEDPEAKGDVVDALQRHDLGNDHEGIPDSVAETAARHPAHFRTVFTLVFSIEISALIQSLATSNGIHDQGKELNFLVIFDMWETSDRESKRAKQTDVTSSKKTKERKFKRWRENDNIL